MWDMLNDTPSLSTSVVPNREFARRDDCSDALVRRAIKNGRLPVLEGGKVDAAFVGSPWRREQVGGANTANTVRTFDVRAEPGETLEDAASRLASVVAPQFATKADAERFKETYIALLRKLEHDEKAGEVVKISDVARIVGGEYSKVRSRLMEIAVTVAPSAALLTTPEAIRDLISKEVSYALQELAFDGSFSPRA